MISGGGQYLASVSELAKIIEFQTKERLIFFLQAFSTQIPPATIIPTHLTTQVTSRIPVQ